MTRLTARLAAVEVKLLPKPPAEMRGTIELHHTEAWPDCLNFPEVDCQHCTEHGPNCAATITPILAPIRHLIILMGAKAGPSMGLD